MTIARGQLYFVHETMNTITAYQNNAPRPAPAKAPAAEAPAAQKTSFRRLWGAKPVDVHAVVTYNATAKRSVPSVPKHVDTYA